VPGITKFIGNQGGPQAIPDDQIEGVRTVVSLGVECISYPFLNVGDRVRVTKGVLTGIEGTLLRIGPASKLVISVEMIQRSIAITVQSSDVERLISGPQYLELSA
jgi:transcription antitermination factor NusG